MTAEIDFDAAFDAPVKLVPVILVAGVPLVLVPAGIHPTATAVTSGTVDTAWWPGTGSILYGIPDPETEGTLSVDPVRDWLELGTVWSTVEQARPLEGDVRVEAFRFDLHDIDEAVTSAISARDARLGRFLAGDISPTDTVIPVDLLASVPTTGIAHVGREAVVYDQTGTTDGVHSIRLVGGLARRGAFGSKASTHRSPRTRRPIVSIGSQPRWWQGRRVTVFLCTLSPDGTTLYDPTPIYMGTALAGVRLTDKGTRYQVPLDPVTETASRKFSERSVMLTGIQYGNGIHGVGDPLSVYAFSLPASINHGIQYTPREYIDAWNAYMVANSIPVGAVASLDASGRVRLNFDHDIVEQIHAAWDTPGIVQSGSTPSARVWLSNKAMPSTSVALDGKVVLGAEDFAQIPTTLSVTVGDATAKYTLTCDTDSTKGVVAVITAADGPTTTVTLAADVRVDGARADSVMQREAVVMVTKAAAATIGVEARGPTALSALRALVRAVDALDGGGLEEDSIDWDHLATEMSRIPTGGIPEARVYRTTGEDSLLALLVEEMRLRGMMLAMRLGRVTGVRLADFASTELAVAEIDEGDIILDDSDPPEPIMPEVTDNTQPLATGMTFSLPGGSSFGWVDTTSAGDFGPGARLESTALRHLPEDSDDGAIASTLDAVAQQLLGVLAEPSKIFRVTLPPRFLGLFAGDIVRLSHSALPDWSGRRGLDRAVCQVYDCERSMFGEESRALVRVRLSAADVAGYAPAFLVAAGGITGAVITADITSSFGATCFADPASDDPMDGLEVGDMVVLSEHDALTPAADSSPVAVASIDRALRTMTLASAPAGSWATLAAAAEKVVVRFAAYGDSVTRQVRGYAYVADDATQILGGADAPDRWAA